MAKKPSQRKKQNHASERDNINFHRIANMSQLLMHILDRVETLQAIVLATDEERAVMRQQILEGQNGADAEGSGEQGNQAGGDSDSALEQDGAGAAEA